LAHDGEGEAQPVGVAEPVDHQLPVIQAGVAGDRSAGEVDDRRCSSGRIARSRPAARTAARYAPAARAGGSYGNEQGDTHQGDVGRPERSRDHRCAILLTAR
jgi:hypothetical protein